MGTSSRGICDECQLKRWFFKCFIEMMNISRMPKCTSGIVCSLSSNNVEQKIQMLLDNLEPKKKLLENI